MLVSGCASTQIAEHTEPSFDLIISDGDVYDGDGKRLADVDIGIIGNRIVAVREGLAERSPASRNIDANGLVVAPGFIDPHTHADTDLTSADSNRRANLAFAYQGVTTLMVGNDGYGFDLPRKGGAIASTGTNFAFLSGFGDIRGEVVGDANRPATDAEIAAMTSLLKRDFCAGAFGFSAGLYYAPQSFADTEEVVALARVAAEFGGYYDTHLRDESDFSIGLLAAVDEALTIGREADIPVHLAHLKALGPAVWGQSADIIAKVEAAQANGQRVTADQYPWRASGTRISSALVPRAALDGGIEALRARLADPEHSELILSGIEANIARRGGPESLLITASLGAGEGIEGKTLAEVARETRQSPAEVARAILLIGDARLASFNMSSEDIEVIAQQPWVMTGSDGSGGHPRKFASFPKVYEDWVRNGAQTIGWFVRRSAGLPAQTIGLQDRGFLREGMTADIVIFDPAGFAPVADFRQPEEFSRGVRWLLVNGEVVISQGQFTEAMPGKLLRKHPRSQGCSIAD
jgi:N-acyl-D-aspartate/D-glutamate deacylase